MGEAERRGTHDERVSQAHAKMKEELRHFLTSRDGTWGS